MSDFWDFGFSGGTAAKVLITPEVMMKIGSLSNCNALLQARETLGPDRFRIYCTKCGQYKVISTVAFTPSMIPEPVVMFCAAHKHAMDVIAVPTLAMGRKFKEDT